MSEMYEIVDIVYDPYPYYYSDDIYIDILYPEPIIWIDTAPVTYTTVVYDVLPLYNNPFDLPYEAYSIDMSGSVYFEPIEYGIYNGWDCSYMPELKTFGSCITAKNHHNYHYTFTEDYHFWKGQYHYKTFLKPYNPAVKNKTIEFFSSQKLNNIYDFEAKMAQYL